MSKIPKIVITLQDLERLEALISSSRNTNSPHEAALLEELGRAEVFEAADIPPTVVTMNSTVRFTMENSGEEFCLTLVYPKDLKEGSDQISVLAPVGSALLGLSVGDSMEWPRPGGGVITVKILEVVYQPERSGEFHR